MSNLCESYKVMLKIALDHTRVVFAEMDGCLPEEVILNYPGEEEIDIDQLELFDGE